MVMCSDIYYTFWLANDSLVPGSPPYIQKKIFFCIILLQKLEVEKAWEHGSCLYVDCQVKDRSRL